MRLYIFLSLLIFNINLSSQPKEPIAPKEPLIISASNTNKREIATYKLNTNETSANLYFYNVNIIFADKTILNGIISFSQNEIKVQHIKKGFLFRKILKWNEVKNLTILEWQPFEKERITNSNSSLIVYYFYPTKFSIVSKTDEKYTYQGRIPYIEKLILTNEDGSTDIYSFFVDYWHIIGKNKGYWRNSKISNFYYPFKNPHKRVFKIINFK